MEMIKAFKAFFKKHGKTMPMDRAELTAFVAELEGLMPVESKQCGEYKTAPEKGETSCVGCVADILEGADKCNELNEGFGTNCAEDNIIYVEI